jgi:iron complex transport system permease protein
MKVENSIYRAHFRFIWRKTAFILMCFFLIAVISGISLTIGSYPLSAANAFEILANNIFKNNYVGSTEEIVVWTLRLPRIAMGILSGIGLGVSGAAMQAILRNPLASPTTIGVSAAAGLGAALAILTGIGITWGRSILIGNAFVFAMIPAGIIFLLARFRQSTPEIMILAGIGMVFIFGSITSLLQYFATADALKGMVIWLMGDLGRAGWADISATFVVLAVCVPFLIWKSWDLNIMGIGDETAGSLGINVNRTRVFIMMVSSLATATIICFTGMIGFIGLVSPHICRIVIGGDNRFLIPAAGLFGASLLLFADGLARTIMAPVIIPVGIITSCVGGPLFLFLIVKKNKAYW